MGLFAVVPDLDYLTTLIVSIVPSFGPIFSSFYHRGATHSVFFPAIMIVIGIFVYFLSGRRAARQESSDVIERTQDDVKEPYANHLQLFAYILIMSSFLWLFHIILDIDSAEGGILLFWPLDDQVYQPSLLLELLAYPFLVLPWTPVGFEINVEHQTLQALQVYLLNWTPQQFVSYYGTPLFSLSLTGLILHTAVFLLYFNYVLRPLTAGFVGLETIGILQKGASIFRAFGKYFQNMPRFFFLAATLLIIIGFMVGPMLGSSIHETQELQRSLRRDSSMFIPSVRISFETFDQILDPSAENHLRMFVNVTHSANSSLSLVLAKRVNVDLWQGSISMLFS
ncbi:MAG TPA: metal-dependent hydrolase, partial [Candidatus Hodarchaeales archaeon]|nr:metal-dependent hydrolase [Candidatus Hodarchaeales archaeon]